MRRYETYKDSGYSIVGTIPKHWNCAPLKRFLKEKLAYGANETAEESNTNHPRYIRITDISEKGTLNEDFKSLPPEKAKSYLLNQGDLLFARCGATVGKAYMFNESYPACYAGYLIKAVLGKSVSPKFVLYYTQSSSYLEWKDVIFIRSTIQNIGADKYSLLPLPIPPRSEQQHIVAFLDAKIAKIDEYIAKKEAEIESLKEWKKAITAHLVKYGITPNVELHETGVFWWPQAPLHWRIVNLGRILKKESRPRLEGAELLVCTNKGSVTKRGESKTGLVADSDEIYQGVKSGDLLIHGMDTWHGAIAVSNLDGMCTPVVHVCTSKQNVRFVSYYMQVMAYSKIFKLISNGVRQNTSDFRSWDKVRKIPIMLPPLDEQNEIVDYIDSATTKADKMIVELSYHVEHMKEYKQRLISDVVTGKINVQPA